MEPHPYKPHSSTQRTPPTNPLPPRPSAPPTRVGKALYDYQGQHSDELSFREGDTLTLLEQVDRGLWWKAKLRGKSGLAPANYVEVVNECTIRRNWKDSVQDSDEWESSEDEEEGAGRGEGTIVYYYNDAPRSVTVPMELVNRPSYIALYRAIQ